MQGLRVMSPNCQKRRRICEDKTVLVKYKFTCYALMQKDTKSVDASEKRFIPIVTHMEPLEYEEFIAEIGFVLEDLVLFLNLLLDLCAEISCPTLKHISLYMQYLKHDTDQISKLDVNKQMLDAACDRMRITIQYLEDTHQHSLRLLELEKQFYTCRNDFYKLLGRKR